MIKIALLAAALSLVPGTTVSQNLTDYPVFDKVTVVIGNGWVMNFVNVRKWSNRPTEILRKLWVKVEECVGKKRDLDEVTWYLADKVWGELGQIYAGVFLTPPAEIILVHMTDEVIKHEMTHAISMEPGNDELARRCSDAS